MTKNHHIGSNEAKHYSEHSSPQRTTAYALLNRYIPFFKPTETLVDIGCGTGEIPVDISQYFKKIYAFDVSSEAIDFAIKKFSSSHPNVIFFVADARDFILPEQVDWVFSANALHWLSPLEQEKALQAMHRCLKPGGRLILTLGLRHEPLWGIVERSTHLPEWSKYFVEFKNPRAFYTLESYKKLLVDAGFDLLSIRVNPIDYIFKTREAFKAFVRGWLPHINRIPSAFQDDYMKFIVKEYARLHPETSEGITITFRALEVDAVSSLKLKAEPHSCTAKQGYNF